jgi:hypothetical protein
MKKTFNYILFSFLFIYALHLNAKGRYDYMFTNTNWKIGGAVSTQLNMGQSQRLKSMSGIENNPFMGFGLGSYYAKKTGTSFVEFGLQFNQSGYNYNKTPGQTTPLDLNASKEENMVRINQMLIPFNFVFYTTPYRLRSFVSLGVNIGFITRATRHERVYYEQGGFAMNVYNEKEDYSTAMFGLNLGFGKEFDVDTDISVRAEAYLGTQMMPQKFEGQTLLFHTGIKMAFQIQGL